MANHTSAREREGIPHTIKSTKNNKLKLNLANSKQRTANSDAVRRRAQAVIKDRSIDAQS